ncbi:MAG: radical SAM protein [candidate division Zixibacteria bacterium HGW-Zixibacteria-1]|nr:MAG: radical SAM protein [candidate division Zixibacteria bacterium HGW-Zixibacteria-1]
MSRMLNLQKGIIYGPVNSRRLGSSLGINLLPTGFKACSFNCAYCQYGYTLASGYKSKWGGKDMPSVESVATTLIRALDEYPAVSYITFSGNGEPTLHPQFKAIVEEVRKVKEKYAPQARLAILSNSALVGRADIREALGRLDVRFMKLDAGNDEMFRKFNRPHKDVTFDEIIDGLKMLGDFSIQALFAGGEQGNYTENHIKEWARQIKLLRPGECHIYSLDRPTPDGRLTKIDKEGLLHLVSIARQFTDIPIKIF